MIINLGSKLDDIRQAIQGSWSNTEEEVQQDGLYDKWTVVELGTIKFYRRLCMAGKNVLPQSFMKSRDRVMGYLAFTKDEVRGGCIGLQDQYIELEDNALVVIINI
jgi:hypothetical protein